MDPKYIEQYEDFELHHWWFVARRRIIEDWLDRYAGGAGGGGAGEGARDGRQRWLDVGCGTGVLLDSYKRIPSKVGIELDAACVERARAKGLEAYVAEGWEINRLGEFDVISLCDVIEHLEDERPAIDGAHQALKSRGVVLVTVPALPSLWSGHDVVNHHYRRYVKRTLLGCFDEGKWEVIRCSYFSSALLPLIWGARKWKNWRGNQEAHDFKYGAMDPLLRFVFSTEKYWLRMANLPLGSSLILVARKKNGNSDSDQLSKE